MFARRYIYIYIYNYIYIYTLGKSGFVEECSMSFRQSRLDQDRRTEFLLCCYSESHMLCNHQTTMYYILFAGWLYSIKVLIMSCPLRSLLNSTCFHVGTLRRVWTFCSGWHSCWHRFESFSIRQRLHHFVLLE